MLCGVDTEIAYMAGVIDSDGCIGVHVNWYHVKSGPHQNAKQPTYQPMVTLKQLDPEAIELFGEHFGCTYSVENPKGSKRPMNVWTVHSAKAGRVLRVLRPHLRIKTRQADLALELCDLNAAPRRHGFVIPDVQPDEPLVPIAEACERAGKSYSVGIQSVRLGNIPFVRRARRLYVPESYIETWRTRGRGAMRRPEISDRMAEIAVAMKALNSGKRNQEFRTPRRYE